MDAKTSNWIDSGCGRGSDDGIGILGAWTGQFLLSDDGICLLSEQLCYVVKGERRGGAGGSGGSRGHGADNTGHVVHCEFLKNLPFNYIWQSLQKVEDCLVI